MTLAVFQIEGKYPHRMLALNIFVRNAIALDGRFFRTRLLMLSMPGDFLTLQCLILSLIARGVVRCGATISRFICESATRSTECLTTGLIAGLDHLCVVECAFAKTLLIAVAFSMLS